jgi:fatty acid-binding protein DegV
MNIKPIIISDAKGQNFAVEKTRGRKASLDRLIERTVEHYEDVPHQHVFLCHADCLEEAEQFKKDFIAKLGKEVPVTISWVGPGVGASVGPGMMAIFVYGKEVTVNKD